jgi:hypothetical protein
MTHPPKAGLWKAGGIAALLAQAATAPAHHSYAMFDLMQERTIEGRVKAVEWTNPHVWVWVVRKEGPPEMSTFGFEAVSPGELMRFNGWSRASVRVGERVTVLYAPLRSGRKGGALKKITLENGKVLQTRLASVPMQDRPPVGGSDARP